jgi:hypothetical protein
MGTCTRFDERAQMRGGSGRDGAIGVVVELAEFVRDLKGSVLGREFRFGLGVSAQRIDGFDGEYLLREYVAELAYGLMGDVFECGETHVVRNFEVKAGHGFVGDAARIDELEIAGVSGDIEGETVGGDSARDVDADGADLAFARPRGLFVVETAPDAGESCDAASADAIDSAEADERFFHHANEVDGTEPATPRVLEAAEIEDGVANELAGAMVGDVATAIDFVEGDAAAQEELVRGEDVGAAGVAAKRKNRRVFEEEEGVFDETGQTHGRDFRLKT